MIVDAPDVAGEADERLLDEVLGGVAIVDEEAGEAHERGAFGCEQLGDESVGPCFGDRGTADGDDCRADGRHLPRRRTTPRDQRRGESRAHC